MSQFFELGWLVGCPEHDTQSGCPGRNTQHGTGSRYNAPDSIKHLPLEELQCYLLRGRVSQTSLTAVATKHVPNYLLCNLRFWLLQTSQMYIKLSNEILRVV